MGFRMRKSISLGKGVRVNVSKRGLSTSVKIGNTTLNTRGKAATRLAPGVSYETSLTGGRKRKTAKASGTKNRTASTSRVNRKDEKKRNARDRAAFREERMAEAGRFDGRSQSSDLPEISPDIVNEPTPYLDNKMGCGTALLYLLAIPALLGAMLFLYLAWYGYSRLAIHPENMRGSTIALVIGTICALIVIAAIISFCKSLSGKKKD